MSDGNGATPGSGDERAQQLRALLADQTLSDADQTSSDADAMASDRNHTASEADQAGASRDQAASDRDQAESDREQVGRAVMITPAEQAAYDASRLERQATTVDRLATALRRADTADTRDDTADARDATATARDGVALERDTHSADVAVAVPAGDPLAMELSRVLAQAGADRARAALDRAQAAADRADWARERAALERQLRSAHLDELTGAYRREMGHLALSHEIDRARRSDGRFVLAFVDVDDLKLVNDRDGHAAGDRVLQSVVAAMRAKLRSFDPVMRYGGDEFVAGMGSTDLADAERRFDDVRAALHDECGIGIGVGLALLGADDTPDTLITRADEQLLTVKAVRHDRAAN
jgi:diguanylate cyclase (GGDEF)-like protein